MCSRRIISWGVILPQEITHTHKHAHYVQSAPNACGQSIPDVISWEPSVIYTSEFGIVVKIQELDQLYCLTEMFKISKNVENCTGSVNGRSHRTSWSVWNEWYNQYSKCNCVTHVYINNYDARLCKNQIINEGYLKISACLSELLWHVYLYVFIMLPRFKKNEP